MKSDKAIFVIFILILALIFSSFVMFKMSYFCRSMVALENGGLHVDLEIPPMYIKVFNGFGELIWKDGMDLKILITNLVLLFFYLVKIRKYEKERKYSGIIGVAALNTLVYLILITVMFVGIQPVLDSVHYAASAFQS